jgi:hypothetical protein
MFASLEGRVNARADDNREEAFEAIRSIVEKIVLHPRGACKPIEIEIYGPLA